MFLQWCANHKFIRWLFYNQYFLSSALPPSKDCEGLELCLMWRFDSQKQRQCLHIAEPICLHLKNRWFLFTPFRSSQKGSVFEFMRLCPLCSMVRENWGFVFQWDLPWLSIFSLYHSRSHLKGYFFVFTRFFAVLSFTVSAVHQCSSIAWIVAMASQLVAVYLIYPKFPYSSWAVQTSLNTTDQSIFLYCSLSILDKVTILLILTHL